MKRDSVMLSAFDLRNVSFVIADVGEIGVHFGVSVGMNISTRLAAWSRM